MLFFTFVMISLIAEISSTQGIDGVRLANGTYGSHMGRVEVLYNNTWGTICNAPWTFSNARVACRELGYVDVLCWITVGHMFPPPPQDTPVWITNLRCRGGERSLDDCPYSGYDIDECNTVTTGEMICRINGGDLVGNVTGLELVNATTTTVKLTWRLLQVSPIPTGVSVVRWRIEGFRRFSHYVSTTDRTIDTFSYVIYNLNPNTTYTTRVRMEFRYSFCNRYLYGAFSNISLVRTAETVKKSNLSLRLVSPFPGVDYLGRVEVMYNNTWGTICDDYASIRTANVICWSLNFQGAICHRARAVYGPGSGPIWMDNVRCNGRNEALEDCQFDGWGQHNCRHRDDVSVICQPNGYTDPISGLQVVDSNAYSVSLSWNPFTFPLGINKKYYLIRYKISSVNGLGTTILLRTNETRRSINRLVINSTYSFTVGAVYGFPCYGRRNQYNTISEAVTATTIEKGPGGPPTSVHVIALNSTAIEIQWNLPLIHLRNGVIRGFKVFVQDDGHAMDEDTFDVSDGSAREYVVSGLQPSTYYTISVLAYTIDDGPKSIHLTLSTFGEDYIELIIEFGQDGNGQDYVVGTLGTNALDIHCGSGISDAMLTWFYANGSSVSRTNRHVRQGHNTDGTSILQIGNGYKLGYCDAGVYTCMAVWNNGTAEIIETRDFTFKIGNTPPSPSSPFIIDVGSTWITLGWFEPSCDGGHPITEFIIRQRREENILLVTSYRYVYGLDSSRRNYTVYNLEPDSAYSFSVRALSIEFFPSEFSVERSINTLTEGPSPPRDVIARLVKTPVVEIRWREPTYHSGIIVYYKVYAQAPMVLLSLGGNTSTPSSLSESSLRVPGHVGAVNMTVTGSHSDVHFQVSAIVLVDGVETEGDRSEITSDSTVFVPIPNLPMPDNVRVTEFTNISVTITWNYPILNFYVPILHFMVAYTSHVTWASPKGYLVEYDQSMSQNVSASLTVATITHLTPDTEYRFRISAVTNFGRGQERIVSQSTAAASGDKMTFFQIMIHPIPNCFDWKLNSSIKSIIKDSLTQTLINTLCISCNLMPFTIQAPVLTCDGTARDQALFYGRIIGTGHLNSRNVTSLLESWILSDRAVVTIDSKDYNIDSDCPLFLDSPFTLGCSRVPPQTTPTMTSASSSPTTTAPVSISEKLGSSITSGEMGGLVIGTIILILLVVFVILLAVLLIRSFFSLNSTIRMKTLIEEDVIDGKLIEHELKNDNPLYEEGKDNIYN